MEPLTDKDAKTLMLLKNSNASLMLYNIHSFFLFPVSLFQWNFRLKIISNKAAINNQGLIAHVTHGSY